MLRDDGVVRRSVRARGTAVVRFSYEPRYGIRLTYCKAVLEYGSLHTGSLLAVSYLCIGAAGIRIPSFMHHGLRQPSVDGRCAIADARRDGTSNLALAISRTWKLEHVRCGRRKTRHHARHELLRFSTTSHRLRAHITTTRVLKNRSTGHQVLAPTRNIIIEHRNMPNNNRL